MKKIYYLIEEQDYPVEVQCLVESYRLVSPNETGDFALARRLLIGRDAYEMLEPQDFHKFFRAVVVTDAMRDAPHLYERASANT